MSVQHLKPRLGRLALLLASVLLTWHAGAPAQPTPAPSAPPTAATPPAALDLATVQSAAHEHLSLRVAAQGLAAARAELRSADRAPLPTLSAGVSSIDLQHGNGPGNLWNQRLDKSLGLDWTLERGGKRQARTEAARANALAAQADVQDLTLQVLDDTGQRFYELLAAQARVQLLQGLAQDSAELARVAELRERAGDLSAQDLARTRIEAQRAVADVQAAQAALAQARWALAQAAGLRDAQQTLQGRWPERQTWPAQLPQDWIDKQPALLAAQQRVLAAEQQLSGALALRKADPTLGASIDHYPGTSSRLLALRVSIPLQDASYFDGEVLRAQAQLQQAREQAELVRQQLQRQLQGLLDALRAAETQRQTHVQQVLPPAQAVLRQAELAFAKGGLSLSDLLDARRTLKAAQLDALAAELAHAQALVALQVRSRPESLNP